MSDKVYPFNGMDTTFSVGRRVLSLKRVPGGVCVREECDEYFYVVLDPEQVEAFIACLREVAARPVPPTGEDA